MLKNDLCCSLQFEDFKEAFEFGTKYYLDPEKITTGRTTAEPRGLGAILDSFTIGKIVEIGVKKILEQKNPKKQYLLDFDIKKNYLVKKDPDIIGVYENGLIKKPNLFLEIKYTQENDRWLGITEEQFNTIKRNAENKDIYFIYASLFSKYINNNPRTSDLTGMFIKKIENTKISKIFQNFSELNASCKIELILSANDISKFAFPFERGMYFYETNIFKEIKKESVYTSNNKLRKDILNSIKYVNFNSFLELSLSGNKKEKNRKISLFNLKGSFILHNKKNKTIIECLNDVYAFNYIFGNFYLKKNHFYDFNLKLVGRDPVLKRNNLFISKKRAYELISENKIKNPNEYILEIVEKI